METHTWWNWRSGAPPRGKQKQTSMSADEMWDALAGLAERCVVVDNVASRVTPVRVRVALEQLGTKVLGVKMLISPATKKFVGAVIVEMRSKEEREKVVTHLREFLFMFGGGPRPARAIPATPLLLIDHPWRRHRTMFKARLFSPVDEPSGPARSLMLDRWHLERELVDDDEELQSALESREVALAEAHEAKLKELKTKLAMIKKEEKSGNIAVCKILHGLKK